jgi:BioD-like phosphotransacetylase family protein
LSSKGQKVGYFKPVSTQPWEVVPGQLPDEDAEFVRRTLDLGSAASDLVGLVLSKPVLREVRCGCADRDLLLELRAAYQRVAFDKGVMLLEGGASLCEGTGLSVDPPRVAQALDVDVLVIVPFRSELSVLDGSVLAQEKFGERLAGVVINAVPGPGRDFVEEVVRPSLEERGIWVFGVLPHRKELRAISVGELAQVLEAELLSCPGKTDLLIEHLVVGAMNVDQALPRIRRVPGTKAVITGGDRVEMQYVALETASDCLILTGHLRPTADVLHCAVEAGVPVLLVRNNTLETVEAIERVFGKTRLGLEVKLRQFEEVFRQHFELDRLLGRLGIS